MHAIKKAARREAWFNRPDDQTKPFNPFGRMQHRQRRVPDEESANGNDLRQLQSANNYEPAVDKQRREDGRPLSGVQKSGTYPAGPNGDIPNGREDIHSASEDTAASSGATDEKFVNGGGPHAIQEGETHESVGAQDGARKRKSRKFMPWKKSEDDGANVKRSDTSESKKKGKFPKPSFMTQFKAVFGSWINLMLVFVPVGIALNYAHVNKIIVFVINFLAIVPLAAMLSYSTEELAMYIGETLGGLLNATFGNAVELIVGVIALNQGQILIVQTSLIGSMLSNLLLVMGMCFFFGGLKRTEQFFNLTVAQTASSLLALAVGALIIPTVFKNFAPAKPGSRVTPPSRGVAVMLLFVYACYLFFQLKTHVDMYNEPSQKSPKKPSGKKEQGMVSKGLATMGAGTGAAAAGGQINQENLVREEAEEEETPQLSVVGAVVTLAGSTVLIALCAEFMVSAIGAVAESVSPEFIGLILLPIVGNAAEHATAVTVAIKDKMDLAIGVAVGSSLQVALLILPIMVCLNWWGVGAPADLTLAFDGFQIGVLFIAIIVVNYVIMDGKSHWLEGVMLQVTYLIIALCAWFYETDQKVAG